MTILNGENLGTIKTSIEGLLTTQPNHADTFNAKFKELIDNDVTLQSVLREYIDTQVNLITSTGVPKLVSYFHEVKATEDNQSSFEIPLTTFYKETDTILVFQNGVGLNSNDYSINQTDAESKGYIILTTPVYKDTEISIVVLKNVPTGEEGSTPGTIILDRSIPLSKLQTPVCTQYEAEAHMVNYVAHPAPITTQFKEGTQNVYTGSFNYPMSEYIHGIGLILFIHADSVGEVKVDISKLGEVPIVTSQGKPATNFKAGSIYTVRYSEDTENFILQGEGADVTPLVENINKLFEI